MSKQQFLDALSVIAAVIGDKSLDGELDRYLNELFPADGDAFQQLKVLCAEGDRDGWLMQREADGIRFGRAIKPGSVAGSFSVDVVRMKDVKGPHHIHVTGEIGAIMSINGQPEFDGRKEGWYVYGPGSDHYPTVTNGDAYVLYLLPEGQIEFTGR